MFSTVNCLLASADLALALCNLQFAIQDVLGADARLVPPPGWGEGIFLHDFLDDGLNGGRGLGNLFDDSGAGRADDGRLRGDDTTWRASEDLRLATGDFGLALGDSHFARDERLRTFWRKISPKTLVRRIVWITRRPTAALVGGQREHDRENREDEREDEEQSGRRDGPVMVMPGGTASLPFPFSM